MKEKEHWSVKHHNNIPDSCKGCYSHYSKYKYLIYGSQNPCTFIPGRMPYDKYLEFTKYCPCGSCLVKLTCTNIQKERCPLFKSNKINNQTLWSYIHTDFPRLKEEVNELNLSIKNT